MNRLAAYADALFLVTGTALLAVGATFIHPAGPWFVVGAASTALGVAVLAVNVRSGR